MLEVKGHGHQHNGLAILCCTFSRKTWETDLTLDEWRLCLQFWPLPAVDLLPQWPIFTKDLWRMNLWLSMIKQTYIIAVRQKGRHEIQWTITDKHNPIYNSRGKTSRWLILHVCADTISQQISYKLVNFVFVKLSVCDLLASQQRFHYRFEQNFCDIDINIEFEKWQRFH